MKTDDMTVRVDAPDIYRAETARQLGMTVRFALNAAATVVAVWLLTVAPEINRWAIVAAVTIGVTIPNFISDVFEDRRKLARSGQP